MDKIFKKNSQEENWRIARPKRKSLQRNAGYVSSGIKMKSQQNYKAVKAEGKAS